MAAIKIELDVELTCNSCVDSVSKELCKLGDYIQDVSINLEDQLVILTTTLPASQILNTIEQTGRKAVIKGFGLNNENLKTAVSAITGNEHTFGVVRFTQLNENTCLIDGTIDGLQNSTPYNLGIYEYGDISQGFHSMGEYYDPTAIELSFASNMEKNVAGNLRNIVTDRNGTAVFRFESLHIRVNDIIGRSFGVTSKEECSAYGIIARSAGLFENPKRICVCSGKTVWQERQENISSKM